MDISQRRPRTRFPLSPQGRGWRAQRAGRGASVPVSAEHSIFRPRHRRYCSARHCSRIEARESPFSQTTRRAPSPLAFSGMLSAVQFHDQPMIKARKINDVGSNRHLALELVSTEAMRAQPIPQPALGVGHVVSQTSWPESRTFIPSPGSACGRATLSPAGRGDRCHASAPIVQSETATPPRRARPARPADAGRRRPAADCGSAPPDRPPTRASFSRASSASRWRFHMLA